MHIFGMVTLLVFIQIDESSTIQEYLYPVGHGWVHDARHQAPSQGRCPQSWQTQGKSDIQLRSTEGCERPDGSVILTEKY